MASSLWWFLDVLVVCIVIISAFAGAKRGFLSTLASAIGCVVAMALAVAVSGDLSVSIYDSLIRDEVLSKTSTAISSYKGSEEISLSLSSHYEGVTLSSESVSEALSNSENISQSINELLCSGTGQPLTPEETDKLLQDAFETTFGNKIEENLPAFCMQKLREDTRSDTSDLTTAVFSVVSGNTEDAAEFIESTYIRPVIVSVIKTICIIVIFTVVAVAFRLASDLILKTITPEPIKTVDKFAGLIIGALLGVLAVVVIGMGIDALITMSDGELVFLNESTIEKTRVFKHILL